MYVDVCILCIYVAIICIYVPSSIDNMAKCIHVEL